MYITYEISISMIEFCHSVRVQIERRITYNIAMTVLLLPNGERMIGKEMLHELCNSFCIEV